MGKMLPSNQGVGWLKYLPASLTMAVVGLLGLDLAGAQTCGTDYTIKEGDTLTQIASRVYGNPKQWTVIFSANQDRLANRVSMLEGLTVRLPCIGNPQPAPAPVAAASYAQPDGSAFITSSPLRRIEFLTAEGVAPYTGRSLHGGGMITQLINSAMAPIKEEAKGRFDYGISWVNDWDAHLDPLLLTRAFDAGFPWARPDCEDMGNLDRSLQIRCQRFFFSEPLYETATGLFVRNASKIKAPRKKEIAGMTLCWPAGQPIHDLDKSGRNWVKDGVVKTIRPPSVDECFRLLDQGTVDAVVEAELVGRASITSLGLGDKVRMLDRPLALTAYHVLVSKSHPHARTILYYVNSSLEKLRETGEYDRVIKQHLARFWEAQNQASPMVGPTPAFDKAPPPNGPSPLAGGGVETEGKTAK